MKKKLTSILLFAFSLSAYSQHFFKTSESLILKADSLFDAGDIAVCTPIYKAGDSIYKFSKLESSLYCRSRFAECLNRQGKLEESQKVAEELVGSCPENFSYIKGEALNTLGLISLEKGRQEMASQYFEQSLSAFNQEEKSPGKAKCYSNIGLLNWLNGNQTKAVEHMYQALEMRKQLLGEIHPLIGDSYNNLGLIYSVENPEKAIEFYNKALEIYKSVYTLNHPSIAIALNNIGIIQRKLGDALTSLSTFEKSLQIWSSIYGKNHPNVAFVYTNMGESYLASEQSSTALEYQQKALEIYKTNYGEKHPEVATTYNSIGTIFYNLKQYEDALEHYQSAICANVSDYGDKNVYSNPSIKNYYNPDLLLVSLMLKSRTLEMLHYNKTLKLKDLRTAFTTLESCDTLLSKIRQVRTGSKDKIEAGRLGSEIYENTISIALALSDITLEKKYFLERAYYFSEKNKGAVLLESIADAQAKSFAGIPDSILENEKVVKNDIAYLEQKLAQRPPAEEEKKYRDKLFLLNNQYERLIKNLEKNYPSYFNLKYNERTATVKDIQTALAKDEALLNYFIADSRKRIYIFYISEKDFRVINNPLPDNFTKNITTLRNSIKLDIGEAYCRGAHQLYQTLIPSSIPAKITKLVIIPEGSLGSIPFEVLLEKKVKETKPDFSTLAYLLKKYSISYNYSSVLFYDTKYGALKHEKKPSSILACAPVHFGEDKDLKSLPASKDEAQKIDTLFKSYNCISRSILFSEANEKVIKSEELKNYKFLHFATHGIVNEQYPELSQLYLAPTQDKKEDGDLFSGEIYNLEIEADLVVLSACQTGLGTVKKGEGIIGLSRALIYAGAGNVIVSLWTVSDESTSELMINFYSAFLTEKSSDYTESLRKAKLKLISEKKFSRPYFWAPFIFIGK